MDLPLQGRDSLLLVGNLPDQQQDVMVGCLSVVFHHVTPLVLKTMGKVTTEIKLQMISLYCKVMSFEICILVPGIGSRKRHTDREWQWAGSHQWWYRCVQRYPSFLSQPVHTGYTGPASSGTPAPGASEKEPKVMLSSYISDVKPKTSSHNKHLMGSSHKKVYTLFLPLRRKLDYLHTHIYTWMYIN